MFTSILEIDRSAIKNLKITDPYSLHRIVYSLYEDIRSENEKNSSTPSGFLYADLQEGQNRRKIILLSNRKPVENVNGYQLKIESKSISEHFLEHSTYQFKVIINPTKRDSHSRKLLPIKGKPFVSQWFTEKALLNWGFSVEKDTLQIHKIEVQKFTDKNKKQITLAQAHIEGILKVTDHTQFKKSFIHGIGRARSFGCGLLQIIPIN